MNRDIKQSDAIKQENRKALKTFIPILVVGGLIGGLLGFFSQTDFFQNGSGNLGEAVGTLLGNVSPYLVIAAEAVSLAAALRYLKKAKKEFAGYKVLAEAAEQSGASEEDEDALDTAADRTDRMLGLCLVASNIGNIVSFLFFGMFMCSLTHLLEEGRFLITVLAIAAFLAGMFAILKLQQLATDLVKQMNPKMKGSVYDVNFNKKWEESCDEAEMMAIYRASYRGFRTGNLACVVLWVTVCLGDMFFHYGSMPVVSVSVIWLVMTASYYIESFRLEYGERKGKVQ